jgi:hypothetical protein
MQGIAPYLDCLGIHFGPGEVEVLTYREAVTIGRLRQPLLFFNRQAMNPGRRT